MFDFNPANFAQIVVNCLAVGGGFLAGFGLTAAVVWWVDRTFFLKKSPDIAKRVARVLGGLAVAILIAMLVFGKGGGGIGGGKGDGVGEGAAGTPAGATPADPTGPPQPVLPKETTPPADRVRVTMLGGADVKEQKFYLIDADATPRTYAEVKAAVAAKRDAGKKASIEIRFPPRNTLPQDHPAVTLLANWARENGFTVTFPADAP